MNDRILKDEILKEIIRRGLLEQEEPNNDNSKNNNDDFCEMVCRLLNSQTQVHIFHLQTKTYSEHKALQNYYENIDDLVDGLIESYQGKYGILTNVKSYENVDYDSKNQVIDYFNDLSDEIETLRESVKDSFLQNQVDTILELIYSTVYKLKFLS
jgi:hypothetical protein